MKGKASGLLLALGLPGKGKPEAKEPEDDTEEDGDTDEAPVEHSKEQLDAAQALLDAIEAKDPKALVTAHKLLMMECEDDGDDEPPPSGRYG